MGFSFAFTFNRTWGWIPFTIAAGLAVQWFMWRKKCRIEVTDSEVTVFNLWGRKSLELHRAKVGQVTHESYSETDAYFVKHDGVRVCLPVAYDGMPELIRLLKRWSFENARTK